MVRVTMVVIARLDLGGFEWAAATLCELLAKLHLGFEQMGARPCKLAVVAALSLAGLEQAKVVTTRLDLSSFKQAMAKLSVGDFE